MVVMFVVVVVVTKDNYAAAAGDDDAASDDDADAVFLIKIEIDQRLVGVGISNNKSSSIRYCC